MSCLRWTLVIAALSVPAVAGAEPRPAPVPSAASEEASLAGPLERERVVRIALSRNPGLRGGHARAAGMRLMGEADSRMPAPEAEVQVWQVPMSRPWALQDSNMVMVTVKQPIPAPGSLSAKAQARSREAELEEAMVAERERELRREVQLALADYQEAAARHAVHLEHKATVDRVAAVARARYASGGALTEVTQAEVEAARIEVDLAQEHAKLGAARAMLNGLLLRAADAPLGAPPAMAGETAAEPLAELLAAARSLRPELRTAQARHAAREAELRVSEREAAWPMLSVGATYFPPTNNMPMHGYGVSLSSTLPWLWGKARAEARAGRQNAAAVQHDIQDAAARVSTDVSTRSAAVQVATRRLEVLRERALPAANRAWQAAAAGYESGRTEVLMLLMARTSIVEIEVDVVEAKAMLEQALVQLEWAVGRPVKRSAIGQKP
jgi:outer membrane protein TolC